ncbi:exported hypothetical protein [Vibrio harveyi]|nr:exported hypothetical protein [Vibrio harveyi]
MLHISPKCVLIHIRKLKSIKRLTNLISKNIKSFLNTVSVYLSTRFAALLFPVFNKTVNKI